MVWLVATGSPCGCSDGTRARGDTGPGAASATGAIGCSSEASCSGSGSAATTGAGGFGASPAAVAFSASISSPSSPATSLPVAARPPRIALIRSSAARTRVTVSGVAVSTPSRTFPSTFSAACATCSNRGRPRKPQVPLIVCTSRKISDSVSWSSGVRSSFTRATSRSAMLSLVSVRKSAIRSSMAALSGPVRPRAERHLVRS